MFSKTACLSLLLSSLVTAGCSSTDLGVVDADPSADPSRANDLFTEKPLYVTGAFDGSKRFGMWVATMEFARKIERDFGKALHFTYFINTCYYDHTTRGSAIGRSHSVAEDTVRMALTQQAVNEGHEIASHAVLHKDGTNWSVDRWRTEFDNFDDVMSVGLFEPIYDDDGSPVFPDWQPTATGGAIGATCDDDHECGSGECLMVSAEQGFCSQGCNSNNTCPNDTVCGAPDWNSSRDRCVPMPSFPVVHNGQELFGADGKPNLSHPDLQPYNIIGFRAPQLGRNPALYKVLEQYGFRYDTSDPLWGIEAPFRARNGGQTFSKIFQFGLMKNRGSRTIPMDYNYKVNDAMGDRMLSDYKKSIVDSYNRYNRVPWNMGHHFALWNGGTYWKAMQDTFIFAAQGCLDGSGVKQCEHTEFPSFAELSESITGLGRINAREDGRDPFLRVPEQQSPQEAEKVCPCEGDDSH